MNAKHQDAWRALSRLEKQLQKQSISPEEFAAQQQAIFATLSIQGITPSNPANPQAPTPTPATFPPSRPHPHTSPSLELEKAPNPPKPPPKASYPNLPAIGDDPEHTLEAQLDPQEAKQNPTPEALPPQGFPSTAIYPPRPAPATPHDTATEESDYWDESLLDPNLSSISMDGLRAFDESELAELERLEPAPSSQQHRPTQAPFVQQHPGEASWTSASRHLALTEVSQTLRERYYLERLLGSGGMGQVFLANDLVFGGHYALKVLHPWITQNQEAVRRFVQEFKLTERLNHPGIVRTFTLDEDANTGHLFYTMEYVEGVTLKALVDNPSNRQQRPMSLKETYHFLEALTDILDYAHSKKVVHRDLKPANILLNDGREKIKLVDFGIAKTLNTNPTYHTGHGGTFYYIAPEQLVGGEKVSPAADVFSIGVLSYQLLTGEIPVAMAIPPSELNPELTRSIDHVIRKAIHPRPEQRFQNISSYFQAFQSAIQPLLKSTQLPNPTPRNNPTPHTSNPTLFPKKTSHSGIFNAVQRAVRTVQHTPPPPSQTRSTRSTKHNNTKHNNTHHTDSYQVHTDSNESHKASPPRTKRKALLCAFEAHDKDVSCLAVSPDGKLLASGSLDNTIKIWETSSWFLLHTFNDHKGAVHALRWSPDGRFVVSASNDRTLRVWDVFSARLQHLFQHDAPIHTLALSPNGKKVVSGADDHVIRLWDLQSGRLINALEGHTAPVRALDLNSDGTILASGSEDTTIRIWDLPRANLLYTYKEYWTIVNAIRFCLNDKLLASATADGTLKLWDLETNHVVQTLRGHIESVTCLDTSAHGNWLASGSMDNTVRIWGLKYGTLRHTFSRYHHPVTSLCISPDGTWLAIGNKKCTIQIWDSSMFRQEITKQP